MTPETEQLALGYLIDWHRDADGAERAYIRTPPRREVAGDDHLPVTTAKPRLRRFQLEGRSSTAARGMIKLFQLRQ